MQSALFALIGAYLLRHATPEHHPTVWPYLVFGYAFLAAIVPWFIDPPWKDDFDVRAALAMLIVSALPMAIAAKWMSHVPYPVLFYGCCAVVVWVIILFLFALGRAVFTKRESPKESGLESRS